MSAKKRRSFTKPNEDKNQTTLSKFFQVVPKKEEQEKDKAILDNESGSDIKEEPKENDRYVKVFRKCNVYALWSA